MGDSVDPRRVLQMINNMGYKNVSKNELKEFTKDLKKLIKYEQKSKYTAINNQTRVIHAPENVINVTIIKEASPKKCMNQPTTAASKIVQQSDVQAQTEPTKGERDDRGKQQSKRLLRLPKHVTTKNPKIIYKKGVKNGALVRNTPTDLYQKYQEDWVKFKSYIPGENSRVNVRRSVRQKLQQKDELDTKVYVHFPDEKGDH